MKRYDKYKPSGIDWIGEVPEHWEEKKLKFVVSCNDEVLDEKTDANTIIRYVEISDVNAVDGVNNFTEYEFGKAPSRARRITRKNDIIVSTVRTYLKAIAKIKDDDLIVSTGFAVLRAKGIDVDYLAFTSLSQFFIDAVISDSVGVSYPSINTSQLVNIKIAVPPLAEQEAIAAYLDARCADIDKVVATQQKRIALLQELKQSEITQAVTRGLNPDARMKDSGVEWIGMVPEDWELLRFKMLLREKMMYGANEAAECDDPSYPRYIRITDLTDDGKLRDETFKSLEPEKAEPYLLEKGSLLFARSGATVGKTFLFNEDIKACFAGYLIKAVFNDSAIPEYVYYYTQSKVYENWKNSIFIQATIQNIGAEKYANMPFLRPSVEEQQRIIEHLDRRCGEIDKQIGAVTKQIELLREYKQALITEVVTGKRRV